MSRRESQSTPERNFDTEFSAGDYNKMVQKPKQLYTEENNNEIDELSKEFTAMGCIVDALKRPPNVCIETCVYQSDSEHGDAGESKEDELEEGAYSDAFDELSDEDQEIKETDPIEENKQLRAVQSEGHDMNHGSISPGQSNFKLSKSQSCVSKNPSRCGSITSSQYGSISVPKTQRINMSFNNDRLREIERHNHILLDKILSARNSRKSSIPPPWAEEPRARPAPAAVQRKMQQRQIDRDNMILLRKIKGAKSSSCSLRH